MSSSVRIKEEPDDATAVTDDAPTMLEQSDPQYTMYATICKPEPCDTDTRPELQDLGRAQHASPAMEGGARGGVGVVKLEIEIGAEMLQPSNIAYARMPFKQEPKQEPDVETLELEHKQQVNPDVEKGAGGGAMVVKLEMDNGPETVQPSKLLSARMPPKQEPKQEPDAEVQEFEREQHVSSDVEKGAGGGVVVKLEIDVGPEKLQPSNLPSARMPPKQEAKQEPVSEEVDADSAGDKLIEYRSTPSEVCVPDKYEDTDVNTGKNIRTVKTGSKKVQDNSQKRYECTECHKFLSGAYSLKMHMLTHTGEKPFKCETCKKDFNLSSNLRKHILTHTGEKPFKCSTCNKEFNTTSNLKKHTLTHTGEKPFKCSTCFKFFTRSEYLKIHMLTHSDEKSFKCSTCFKFFSYSDQLKRHMLSHTAEKPFKCSSCNKSYIHSHQLQCHMFTHTGEKPFKCSTCQKSFSRSQHFKRHMLHVHQVITID